MYQKKLICEGVFLQKDICSLRRIWLIAIKYCVEIQRNNRKEKSWMQDKNMTYSSRMAFTDVSDLKRNFHFLSDKEKIN